MTLYEYTETVSPSEEPAGIGWEFWGMRVTPNEEVAVWRRSVSEESGENEE